MLKVPLPYQERHIAKVRHRLYFNSGVKPSVNSYAYTPLDFIRDTGSALALLNIGAGMLSAAMRYMDYKTMKILEKESSAAREERKRRLTVSPSSSRKQNGSGRSP